MLAQVLSGNFEISKNWTSTWSGNMETVSIISWRADKNPSAGISLVFVLFVNPSFCCDFLWGHHSQGGYSTNLAPTKLVGKLLTLFDSTAHRVVGGLPPPVPSASHGNVRRSEQVNQPGGPRVSNSQSTMAMSSLMPSASMEPISDWMGEGNRLTKPNRSISEPDFGRTPRKVDVDIPWHSVYFNALLLFESAISTTVVSFSTKISILRW